MKVAPKKTEVTVPKAIKRIIRIAEVITVSDLAKRMGAKGGDLIKKLMDMGVVANINQVIDTDVASLVANEFGYEVEKTSLEHQDYLERLPNGYTCHFVRPGWKLPVRAKKAG